MELKWNDNTGSLLGEQHGGICFRWNEQASQRIRLGIGNIKLNDHHNIIFITQISYWIFKIMRFYIHPQNFSFSKYISYLLHFVTRKKIVFIYEAVWCLVVWKGDIKTYVWNLIYIESATLTLYSHSLQPGPANVTVKITWGRSLYRVTCMRIYLKSVSRNGNYISCAKKNYGQDWSLLFIVPVNSNWTICWS